MKNHVWWAWSHVVVQSCLESLALEFWFGVFCQAMQVCTDFCAFGVADWIYADFDSVCELENWFQEWTLEQLISDLFSHFSITLPDANYYFKP